jgi:hypothetical protein
MSDAMRIIRNVDTPTYEVLVSSLIANVKLSWTEREVMVEVGFLVRE